MSRSVDRAIDGCSVLQTVTADDGDGGDGGSNERQ